tara:strand:+ start:3906 stop:4763 length:858 start_codon:yes stop_codon:yes gene_type:complete
MSKFAYHPGNVAHSSAPEVEDTMQSLSRALGIKLIPLSGATSCGAGIVRQANKRLQLTLNARTFAMAESMGLDILTPCAATAGNLHEDLMTLRSDQILMSEVNDVLLRTCNLTMTGEVNVHHLIHAIVDIIGIEKLDEKVVNPFDFKIAGYYGPNIQQDGACGEDDIYDPDYLEKIILSVGGTPVKWDARTQSVGTPSLFSEEPTVMKQAAEVLSEAKSEDAELIVSACSLSHGVLDIYQGKAGRNTGLSTNIPVIHLCEMISFALGCHNNRLAMLRTRITVIGD